MQSDQDDTIKSNVNPEISNDSIAPETPPETPPPEVAPEATPKKTRKPLSEDALQKLKVAREKAAEANRAKKLQREKDKEAREKELEVAKSPLVLVEQSESDEEDLIAPPGVIVVRRRRQKPKEPEKTEAEMHMDKLYMSMFG